MTVPALRRCAIYTRKSSEQGLEQEFNSLDAQREAAAAYIASQKHDGWREIGTRYDDGGWSGGNMDRPALAALLADVEAGKVDIVVVYKVDRLTRSLADFAKLIEVFDRKGASFVSVTQAFNTTTSMGRLTLNVLLSFAQFEREVTGERIRDKVAASKKKGIFMGGNPPLGYDIGKRKLEVNPIEAEQVRGIFQLYLELGCVSQLKRRLDASDARSKAWVTEAGRAAGGKPFSKGALYHLLKNRVYLGETGHKGKVYPGEHAAILDRELFDAVQGTLGSNRLRHRSGRTASSPSLLRGIIRDHLGRPMTPSHSNKEGRRYRYYISSVFPGSANGDLGPVLRLPATEIETVVLDHIKAILASGSGLTQELGLDPVGVEIQEQIRFEAKKIIGRLEADVPSAIDVMAVLGCEVIASTDNMSVSVEGTKLYEVLNLGQFGTKMSADHTGARIIRAIDMRLQRHGAGKRIFIPDGMVAATPAPNVPLIKAISQAFRWRMELEQNPEETLQSIADRSGYARTMVSRRIALAYLAPDVVKAIFEGRQRPELQLENIELDVPIGWAEQRQRYLTAAR